MVYLLQRNPSTLKLQRNPVTGKLMRAGPYEEPPEDPCDYCSGEPPATCQLTIAGVVDCVCFPTYFREGYNISPSVAAALNGVHVLNLVDGIGVCKYEKIITGSWDFEYWIGDPEPAERCQELDTVICTFTEIKIELIISTNLYLRIYTSTCEYVFWPPVKYFFYDVLAIPGFPPCTDLDGVFVNECLCEWPRDSVIQGCEDGTATLVI